MAKRDPLSQAQKLEQKIKEMREKQQQYIEKAEREIGSYLMKKWDIEDIDDAKEVIDYLESNVDEYFNKSSEENQTNHEDIKSNAQEKNVKSNGQEKTII